MIKRIWPLLFVASVAFGQAYYKQVDVDYIRLDDNIISITNVNSDLKINVPGTGRILFSNMNASTVPYIDSSKKLQSESQLSPSRGGLGLDISASTGVLKVSAGTVSAATITNSDVNASAAIARSKIATGSTNRLVVNDGSTGALTDASAITAARVLISDANGIPTHSTVTSTELAGLSGLSGTYLTNTNTVNVTNKTLDGLLNTLTNLSAANITQGSFGTAQTVATAGAASTPAWRFTGAPFSGGTATTTKPLLSLEDATTSTAWSTSGTYLGINGKASHSGRLIDIQQEAISRLNLTSTGILNLNDTTGTAAANLRIPLTNLTLPTLNVKAQVSQTGDLFQVMDSSGAPKFIFDSNGNSKFNHNVATSEANFDVRTAVTSLAASVGSAARFNSFFGDAAAVAAGRGAGIALGGPSTSATVQTEYALWWATKNNANSGDLDTSMFLAARRNSDSKAALGLKLDERSQATFFGNLVLSGSTSGQTTIVPGATITNNTLFLPTSQGNANTYLKNDGTGVLSWAEASSGVGTNFVTNYSAESGTTGWATYADGASLVDGTGGSPSVTWTQYSSFFPLSGSKSFLLTKGATNRQGDGASYDFTIDSASVAKVLQIDFDYIVESGTFVAGTSSTESDVVVYIYDVTNARLIQPSTYKLYSNSSTVPGRFTANFQSSSGSTSYRLILHVGSTSASAYTLKLDTITVSPSKYVYGTPITDWVSFIPANGSWTANVAYSGYWRRVGGDMEVVEKVLCSGAPTNTSLQMKLPTGYAIDTARLTTSTAGYGQILGEGHAIDSGATLYPGWVVYNDTTSVAVYVSQASGTYANAANFSSTVPITFGANDFVEIKYRVPIAGWSSNVQMSDTADQRVVSFMAHRSSNQTGVNPNNSGVAIVYDQISTVTPDTHGAFNTSNGRFTAPVSGYYAFSASFLVSGTNVLTNEYYLGFRKNGSDYAYPGWYRATAGTSFALQGAIQSMYLNAGDYVDVAIYGIGNNSVSTLTISGASLSQTAMFTGHRLSGPSAIGATETIAARYYASSTSISSSAATIVWTTKDFDTHSGMSSGVYTLPAPGKYQVNTCVALSGTYALNNNVTFQLQKNGVAYSTMTFYAAAAITAHDPCLSDVVSGVAGDTIRVQASSQATSPAIVSSNDRNYFTIHRIGL